MSIVVNGVDQIAAHFNVTAAHVLSVYSEYQAVNNAAWFNFWSGWVILTLVVALVISTVYYVTHRFVDAGELFAVFLLVVLVVGAFGGVISAAIYKSYLDSLAINVEYNMYYNWIKGVVGV